MDSSGPITIGRSAPPTQTGIATVLRLQPPGDSRGVRWARAESCSISGELMPVKNGSLGPNTVVNSNQKKLRRSARFQSVSYDLAHFRLFCLRPPRPLGTPKTQLPAPKMPWGVSGSPRRSALFSLVFPRGDLFGSFFREPSRGLIDGRRLRGWRWLTLTRPGWAPTSRDLRRSRSLSRSHDLSRRRPIS